MISPSTLTAAGGARIPTPEEAAAHAWRPLDRTAASASLAFRQRRILSLAVGSRSHEGFPVWAVVQMEGVSRPEIFAHARALRDRRLVDFIRVEGRVHTIARTAAFSVTGVVDVARHRCGA